MTAVTLRPDALDEFADVAHGDAVRLARLADQLERERAVYHFRNADFASRTSGVVEDVAGMAESLSAHADRCGRLAAAARMLDADYSMGPAGPGSDVGIAVVDDTALLEAATSYSTRWAGSDDIREFMRPADQDEWNREVFGQTAGYSHVGGSYLGGGFIMAPNGLEYPMVVPEVWVDGSPYRASGAGATGESDVESLQGSDPGWRTVSIETGITRVRDPMSAPLRWITLAGVATNPDLAPPPAASRSELEGITIQPNGNAYLTTLPSSGQGGLPPPAPDELGLAQDLRPVEDRDGRLVFVNPERPATRHVQDQLDAQRRATPDVRGLESAHRARVRTGPSRSGAGAAANAFDLGLGVVVAASSLQDIREGDHRAFQVVFQHNQDGRRRAFVRFYGIADGVQATTVALDPAGQRVSYPLALRPPSEPVLSEQPSTQPIDR